MNFFLFWSLSTAAIWLFVGLVIGMITGVAATALWLRRQKQ